MLKFFALMLITATALADATLAVPTVFATAPYLATICMNDAHDSAVAGTSTDVVAGTISGTASFSQFDCRLRVHSGRGPGYRIASGCAEVVWNASDGSIVSITPTQLVFGTYQQISC